MNRIYNYPEFSIYFSPQIVVFYVLYIALKYCIEVVPAYSYLLSETCSGIKIILSAPYSVMKSLKWIEFT